MLDFGVRHRGVWAVEFLCLLLCGVMRAGLDDRLLISLLIINNVRLHDQMMREFL